MTFEDWWEARVKPVNPDPAAKVAAMSAWTFAQNQEREACAAAVPSNWCDPLLTGDHAALPRPVEPITPRHIEALLRGIKDAIRARGEDGK